MDIKEIISHFNEEEVEYLYKALLECEFVRVDIFVFNAGAYVTFTYGNDLEYLENDEGGTEHMILCTEDLFDAFMRYGTDGLKEYYDELSDRG